MKGRTLAEATAQMLAKGKSKAEAKRIAPHRVFSGNRPSMTILYKKLDPHTLGRLIALYEHRVFVEAALFDINAFDQWGVELGKELATGLLPVMEGKVSTEGQDSSTAGLVAHLKKLGKQPLNLPRLRRGPHPLPAKAERGGKGEYAELSLSPVKRGEGWGPLRQQWEGEGRLPSAI